MNIYLNSLIATMIMFLATSVGSAVVFTAVKPKEIYKKVSLGFSAGIMIAASIWSLIIPAVENYPNDYVPSYVPLIIGIVIGVLFIYLLEVLVKKIKLNQINSKKPQKIIIGNKKTQETKPKLSENNLSSYLKTFMLIWAITLHNIPEGMSVGLSFAVDSNSNQTISWATYSLAIGIAIQNIPEGAAVSLPLRFYGYSRTKAFIYGCLSGLVEPVAGMLASLISVYGNDVLPYLLCFSAGAMIFVSVKELIPESISGDNKTIILSSFAFMIGFIIMMVLDIALSA